MDHELKKYILSRTEQEDELLHSLWRETNVKIYHPRQLSGHLQGKILEMICHMINPVNILEIGTFTGYSALSMAKALPEHGALHTIEINDEITDFTMSFISKSGYADKIKLHVGDALKIIPELNLVFDLVFIDAEKNQYVDYYELIFEKVRKGGFIIADNVLWNGKVVEDNLRNNDHFTKGIKAFNDHVHDDPRVQNVIFPIRDGLMVLRKI